MGGPAGSGLRTGAVHANSFGANSTPRPSWQLPSYIHGQPNRFQDNRLSHRRFVYGVGYVGLPYYGYGNGYGDPLGFLDPDSGDDTGTGTGQQVQPDAAAGPDYGPQGPAGPDYAPQAPYDQGYGPPPRAPYAPGGYPPPPQSNEQSAAQSAAAQSDGLDHPAVTLVFNDGRPPEKVNSYVLTGSSVFVAESGHQRVIPIADLDLPATVAQNRDAGVDFELPGGTR
jgi:hypothetical protein